MYDTFKDVYIRTVEQGHVTDEFFDTLGYPQDRDATGQIVERLSESDHLQRAKMLNHEYQHEKREKKKQDRKEKIAKKLSETRVALLKILELNAECEMYLLEILGNPNPDGNGVLFGNVTFEQIARKNKCTIARLQAFIHARSWNGPKPRGAANWPKKRDKAENGAQSYVSWAYELRNSPVILEAPDDNIDVDMLDADGCSTTSAPPPTVECMGNDDASPSAAEYLADAAWVDMVGESFKALFQVVTDDMKERANELYSRLLQNLGSHIEKKVSDGKRNHFTLKWFQKNISQFAAIVTLAGHVRDEPAMVSEKDCLLKNPSGTRNRFILVEADTDVSNAEGCYLYFDTENAEWVRSGKVAGTEHDSKGIMDRHEEHVASASRNDNSSDLYVKYPGKQSGLAIMMRKDKVHPHPWRAYFEDLDLYCGIGFIRSDVVEQRLTSSYDDSNSPNGIFTWDKHCIDSLNKCEKDGVTSLKDKQLHMVAYLLELGYDLMLSAGMNVSTMPGFEKFGLPNLYKR